MSGAEIKQNATGKLDSGRDLAAAAGDVSMERRQATGCVCMLSLACQSNGAQRVRRDMRACTGCLHLMQIVALWIRQQETSGFGSAADLLGALAEAANVELF